MTFKYGFEKEAFYMVPAVHAIQNGKERVLGLCPYGVPHDDIGYLAEARSEPNNDIIKAVYLLKAEYHRLQDVASECDAFLMPVPIMKLTAELRREVRRSCTKGPERFQNLYNYKKHGNRANEGIAGLHISITNRVRIWDKDESQCQSFNQLFDFVSVFKYIDRAFAEEIKDARRRPGFYEVKHDGRVEHRSLPCNVDLNKVIDVLQDVDEEMRR